MKLRDYLTAEEQHIVDELKPGIGVAASQSSEFNRYGGDDRFLGLLHRIALLHAKKQADYGKTADPFANVKAASEWGVRPWVGAMIRATDKIRRLQKFAQGGKLLNESAEDSLLDIAVYALIALILLQEETNLPNSAEKTSLPLDKQPTMWYNNYDVSYVTDVADDDHRDKTT